MRTSFFVGAGLPSDPSATRARRALDPRRLDRRASRLLQVERVVPNAFGRAAGESGRSGRSRSGRGRGNALESPL
jgi:hypothetical protein